MRLACDEGAIDFLHLFSFDLFLHILEILEALDSGTAGERSIPGTAK